MIVDLRMHQFDYVYRSSLQKQIEVRVPVREHAFELELRLLPAPVAVLVVVTVECLPQLNPGRLCQARIKQRLLRLGCCCRSTSLLVWQLQSRSHIVHFEVMRHAVRHRKIDWR